MPRVAPERAFDFWPQHKLQLGPEAYSVPPLSLGRFLAVLAAAPGRLEDSMVDFGIAALRTVAEDPKEAPRKLMAAFAAVPPKDMWPLVEAVVPHLPPEAWEEYGGLLELIELALFFAGVHDWDLVGEELGTKESHDVPQKRTVMGALAMFSHHCGRSVEELFAMRLEGFFHYKRGYKEAFTAEEEGSLAPEQMGAAGVADPDQRAGVWDAMRKAEAPNGN